MTVLTHTRTGARFTAPNTGARWLRWGHGMYHVVADDSGESACGRKVGPDPKEQYYRSECCSRCEKRSPDLADAAERRRAAIVEWSQQQHLSVLEEQRAGHFQVLRCKLCGAQHATAGNRMGGVPWCDEAGHVAELEALDVVGPAWRDPEASA